MTLDSTMAPGAFGLAIDSDAGLPGLSAPSAVAGSRAVEHRLVTPEEIRARCGPGDLKQVRHGGEGVNKREYHEHASGGDLIRTASFGLHLVADRGRTLLTAPEDARTDQWQRFVLGQVLPATAGIQGLEIFHASAVSVDGGAVALAGASGAGKSTLAAELIAAGAEFFVDDVLAVETTVAGTMAYPGPGLMSLTPSQIEEYGIEDSVWLETGGKSIVERAGERRSRPIKAFIALTRDESADTPIFRPCPPARLMASTFDALPRGAERLRRLLRVCAQLASDARALELRYSPEIGAPRVAAAIDERLGLELDFR